MVNIATVQKILKLEPIEGADFIDKATLLGWEIVVKKGECKVGDLVGYISIDTVVPELHEYSFFTVLSIVSKKLSIEISNSSIFIRCFLKEIYY